LQERFPGREASGIGQRLALVVAGGEQVIQFLEGVVADRDLGVDEGLMTTRPESMAAAICLADQSAHRSSPVMTSSSTHESTRVVALIGHGQSPRSSAMIWSVLRPATSRLVAVLHSRRTRRCLLLVSGPRR
jgi:hypothetical protein